MAEKTIHFGQTPIIESPVLDRVNLKSDEDGAAVLTNTKKTKQLDDCRNGSGFSKDRVMNTENEQYLALQGFETSHYASTDLPAAASVSSLVSLDPTLHSFRGILEILNTCWSDLEKIIARPLDKNKESIEYQLDRLVFAVANSIPQPIQQNSKLAQIESDFENMTNVNPKEYVKKLKNMIEEECNLIKSLCDQCTLQYKELLLKSHKNDPYFQHGFIRWETIRNHVTTARNNTKSLFQMYVRSGSGAIRKNGASFDQTMKLGAKRDKKVLTKQGYSLDGNGMKSSKKGVSNAFLANSTMLALERNGKKSMKRKRSASPRIMSEHYQQQQRKRSRHSSVQQKPRLSTNSMMSSATASTDPTVTHSVAASTAQNPRPMAPSRRNKNVQRNRKTKVINLTMDDDFEKFRHSFSIEDNDPGRLTNPLLELPQYPCQSKTDVLPQATEMLTLMNLYFPAPDTYPISYYARLLGFDIPASAAETGDHYELDIDTVSLMDRTKDEAYQIPHEGQSWTNNIIHRPCFLEDERRVDLLDPVLRNLFQDITAQRRESFTEVSKETFISSDCIKYARKHGVIDDDVYFRPFQSGDESCIAFGVSFFFNFDKRTY